MEATAWAFGRHELTVLSCSLVRIFHVLNFQSTVNFAQFAKWVCRF